MPRFVGAASSSRKCALPRGGTWRVSFRHRCLRDLGHFGNQKSYGTGAKTCRQAGMSRNRKNHGLVAISRQMTIQGRDGLEILLVRFKIIHSTVVDVLRQLTLRDFRISIGPSGLFFFLDFSML